MKQLFAFLLLLLSYSANAQLRKHPIDIAFDKCIAKDEAEGDGAPGPGRTCEATALQKWNSEMRLLLSKLPSERPAQVAWVRQRDKHVASMKRDFMKSADIASEADLPMTVFDEIRDYQINATRARVLILTKLAHGQPFQLPKE
jgi:hypothetical protein